MATISIADNDARVQYTQAVTADSTQLTIDFPFFSLDDIKVIVTNSSSVDTTLTRGTGAGTFAVNGTSVDDGYSGGNVTLGSSYDDTNTYTIYRDITVTRTTDFPTSGPFNISSLNTELDKLFAISQELQTSIGRKVGIVDSDGTSSVALPAKATRLGKILGFNSSTGVPEMFTYLTNDNVTALNGLTAGTVTASKYVLVDANKDIGSFRNVTLTGELDCATLAVSGNADIDGTLEADAITIDGVSLSETIADTVGAMVSSNTETGVTVTYEDSDNTLDFALGTTHTSITSITNASLVIGRDADNDIDFATDNTILFRAEGADQIKLVDGALTPVTDADVDLGSSSLQFKDGFFHGTLEADALTINGTTLSETISDTVGAMVGSNTETGISVTYDDSDNTLDFVIGTGSITNAMLDGSIADSKLSTISTAGKVELGALEIDGASDIGADLVDADLLIVDDGANGTEKKSEFTRVKKYIYSAMSGDATASDAGAVTIADNAVSLAKMAGITRGSLITGDSSGDPSALAVGTNGQFLKSDGNDLVWGSASISGLAADDITAGDAAINLTTTSGNITIDAQANDSDIIFKGTDDSADTTFLTIDGSEGGLLLPNNGIDLNGKELILDSDADTSIEASTDDTIDIKVAGTDRIRINTTGGLGVAQNTTAFTTSQVIEGRGSSSTGVAIQIYNDENNAYGQLFAAGSGYGAYGTTAGDLWLYSPNNVTVGSHDDKLVKLVSHGAARLTVDGEHVGINTTAPVNSGLFGGTQTSLNVMGSLAPEVRIKSSTGDCDTALIASNSSHNFFIINGANGVALSHDGTSWGSASDERKKDIIENITDAETKINKLRAVIGKYKVTKTYDADVLYTQKEKDDGQIPEGKDVGDVKIAKGTKKNGDKDGVRRSFLLAQDFLNNFPEPVSETSELDDDGKETSDTYYQLEYQAVIPLLVAGIKELSAKCADYETRIKALESG